MLEELNLLNLKEAQAYILERFNHQIGWWVLRKACASGRLKAQKRKLEGQRAPNNELWLVARADLEAFVAEELSAERRARGGAPRGAAHGKARPGGGRPSILGPSRKILIDLTLEEIALIDRDISAGKASSRNDRIRQLLKLGRQAEASAEQS